MGPRGPIVSLGSQGVFSKGPVQNVLDIGNWSTFHMVNLPLTVLLLGFCYIFYQTWASKLISQKPIAVITGSLMPHCSMQHGSVAAPNIQWHVFDSKLLQGVSPRLTPKKDPKHQEKKLLGIQIISYYSQTAFFLKHVPIRDIQNSILSCWVFRMILITFGCKETSGWTPIGSMWGVCIHTFNYHKNQPFM